MSEALHRRARQIRERALSRAWEYRQRHHSHGAWYRLRRVLADAAQAWTLSLEDADALEREGVTPVPVGRELDPPKRIFFVGTVRLTSLGSRRTVPVRLSTELLDAQNIALIPFEPLLPEDDPSSSLR